MDDADRELVQLTAVRRCILACQDASDACAKAIGPAVKAGLAPAHVSLLEDALAGCTMTAAMVGRGSRFRDAHALLCGEVCEAAARSAALHHLTPLRDALLACAEACRHFLLAETLTPERRPAKRVG